MKKLITITLAASLLAAGALRANAQKNIFGAGYINITESGKVQDEKTEGSANGFYIGGSLCFALNESILFRPGLYYTYLSNSESGSMSQQGVSMSYDGKNVEHGIDIPLMFEYGKEITTGTRCFVFAGPSLQYGLSAKSDIDIKAGSYGSTKQTIDSYADAGQERFNILVGGGVGAEFSNLLRVSISYDHSLLNYFSTDKIDAHISRGFVKIGLGILF